MPITAWRCPVCGNQSAPLDHFALSDCGLKVHPSFAASVLRHDREHVSNPRAIGITHLLGCPRAMGIGKQTNWACDPTKHKPAESGTAWHRMVEGAHFWAATQSDLAAYGEALIEQPVYGTIDGVALVGIPDYLLRRGRTIRDWKGKDDAEKAKKYGYDEYAAQMSLCSELVEQDLGWRPERAIIDFHDHKNLAPVTVPLWDLETTLAYHPKKGDKSVREIMHDTAKVKAGATWTDMPLDGESMQMGAGNLCHWCDHRQACRGF